MQALTRLTLWILKRTGWVLTVGALLSTVGLYYSIQLYKNLRTDLEELLPTTARSVVDMNEVTHRLESIDSLAVVILSQNKKASKKFVIDLAHKLEQAPKDTVALVEYKIDEELKFFNERRVLYMEYKDLLKVKDFIHSRIEYEKSLYNPLNIFSTELQVPEPQFDFWALKHKYDSKASNYTKFPDGYYATPDETKRVILAYMPGKSSGIGNVHRLKDYVAQSVAELKPESYDSDLQVLYTGGVQSTIEEQAALIADLELSTVVVTVLVTVAMLLFFRNIRVTIALMTSLFMGTFCTFGASYFAVGYLNANSAFLGSIVIGNGINFGIIFLARYMEERRRGRSNARAMRFSFYGTLTATLTAALAAALSYGSLGLTSFRGFKQFGIIGFIGMALCWISMFTILPALLTVFDRWKPLVKPGEKAPRSFVAEGTARLVNRFPGFLWGFSFLLSLASIAMLTRTTSEILEADLTNLRSKTSLEKGSEFYSKYVDEIFNRYLTPIVILPHKQEDSQKIATLLRQKQKEEGEKTLITSVQTIEDFIPRDQTEKIKLLKDIREMLPPRILRRLSGKERKLSLELLEQADREPLKTSDLPPLILNKFTERDGSIGKLVLIEPPLTNDTRIRSKLAHFIANLRNAADSVAPGTPVAGMLPITSDMLESIAKDGPRATLFAFAAVILLVVFLFRNFKTAFLCLFALILGMLWMGGFVIATNLKINFLNFIALPITFGIGVDYGVNIFQRYKQEGAGSILRVIRDTGGAVTLCSFTTVVGYGSLLLAENQAFVSFGKLAVLGELTCLFAAVITLPAYLLLVSKRKARKTSK